MSEQEEVQEITHPGPILRAARDELRLSIDEVASQLHLRPSVVAMIESENYHDFSSDVFLKGYFRSYCRLVGLHEERMVELLERQLTVIVEEKRQLDKQQADEKLKAKRIHLMKLTGVAGSIVVVCALLVWTLIGSENEHELEQRSDSSLESPGAVVEPPAAPEEVAEENDSVELVLVDEKQSAAETLGETSAVTDVAIQSSNLDAEDQSSESQPVDEVSALSNQDQPQVRGTISITFTGDCWFEIYDDQDNRISADLMRDGRKFDYEFSTALRVVLGDASVAQVFVNDVQYDISSYVSTTGRAEFTVE
ncbi:hypothetical protein A3715_06225 [Oleiphilus sp. HI0009]|nr:MULTISPECIES: helix-turn-helix domain-containing protein [unclassified Oleiphilus]KZX71623.1 hypothetical protein A3715_16290 [Oleiphilus sp. HI0009]KZX82110.1 hypothetical protein A3715_06225 [Oleiphilus sp. HI0009]KZY66354.1 hypothetical protein A3738_06645 [Oleiphilus sp. HI0066]KZY71797.1 hypothetical protein A3739_03965 [Oleiphilus sp. HI0067]